jgi:hypothetical protein
LPPSSRTASKRTDRPARILPPLPLLILVPILLFLSPLAARSQETPTASLHSTDQALQLRITAPPARAEALRDALESGGEAEIRFRIRAYRERRGLAALLGDALLYEHTIVRTATRELFSEGFRIRDSGGEVRYEEFEEFLKAFTVVTHRIPHRHISPAEGVELLYQVVTIPRRLVPPFTILRPFLPGLEESSPWMEVPLPTDTEAGA